MLMLYIVGCLLLVIISVILKINMFLIFILVIWISMIYFSLKKIYRRSALISFLICFFIFYLGREILMKYFSYRVVNFEIEIEKHFYLVLLYSLLSIGFGYFIFTSKNSYNLNLKKNFFIKYRKYSKEIEILFYFIFLISCISKFLMINYVAIYGYASYYLGYDQYIRKNIIFYIITKIESLLPIFFSFYLFTFTSKKKVIFMYKIYFIYLILTLFTGQRSHFLIGIIVCFIYFTKRQLLQPNEKWINRKKLRKLSIIFPFLIISANIFGYYRSETSIKDISIFKLFYDFIYDQGITGNIIKWGYQYKEQFNSELFYTLDFLRVGILGKIFNNTKKEYLDLVDYAMNSGKYGSALSYFKIPVDYLKGYGLGSSYIAELYQDFGYLGVIIGNLIYSYLLVKIDDIWDNDNILIMTVKFLIITPVLWSIRGGFSEFLILIFSPMTILMLIILYIFLLLKNISRNKNEER